MLPKIQLVLLLLELFSASEAGFVCWSYSEMENPFNCTLDEIVKMAEKEINNNSNDTVSESNIFVGSHPLTAVLTRKFCQFQRISVVSENQTTPLAYRVLSFPTNFSADPKGIQNVYDNNVNGTLKTRNIPPNLQNCSLTFSVNAVSKSGKNFSIEVDKLQFSLRNLSLDSKYEIIVTPELYVQSDIRMTGLQRRKTFFTNTKPKSVENLKAQIREDKIVNISWTSQFDRTHGKANIYEVNLYQSPEKTKNIEKVINKTHLNVFIEQCTSYQIKIFAKNIAGMSRSFKQLFWIAPSGVNRVENLKRQFRNPGRISWEYPHRTCIKYFQVDVINGDSEKTIMTGNLSHQLSLATQRFYKVRVTPVPKLKKRELLNSWNKEPAYLRFYNGNITELMSIQPEKLDESGFQVYVSWFTKKSSFPFVQAFVVNLRSETKNCLYRIELVAKVNFPEKQISCSGYARQPLSRNHFHSAELSLPEDGKMIYLEYVIYTIDGDVTVSTKQIFYAVKAGPIWIIVAIFLFVLVIVVIVISLLYHQRVQKRKRNFSRRPADEGPIRVNRQELQNLIKKNLPRNDSIEEFIETEDENEDTPLLEKFLRSINTYRIDSEKFSKYYSVVIKNTAAELISQYKQIGSDSEKMEKHLNLTKFMGKSPYNVKKNRFMNILPFDQTRVLLESNPNNENYVNANFVPPMSGAMESRAYIASQGPIDTTLSEFVLMMWEQNIVIVVMLTRTEEEEKFKCLQYWPTATGEQCQFGKDKEFILTMPSEVDMGSYIERQLVLTHLKTGVEKKMTMLHMLTWCDFSAPKLEDFEALLTRFQDLTDTDKIPLDCDKLSPVLVHCSAGVGRTGTFICLDQMTRQLIHGEKYMDIYRTVLRLRAYRNFMVQRQAQYVFIHDFMNYFVQKFLQTKRNSKLDETTNCKEE